MSEQAGIPVIVASQREDDVEAISRALRNVGRAARCQWVKDARSLPDALSDGQAQLLFVACDKDAGSLTVAIQARDQVLPGLPVIALSTSATEAEIGAAMQQGAQDLVTLEDPTRLSSVAVRELSAQWSARELKKARKESLALSEQLASLIDEASDPIIYVSEGIITNLNRAWLEQFAYAEVEDVVGTPILDVFAEPSRAAIKGALVACSQGKWSGHKIAVEALSSHGGSQSVEATVDCAQHDGETCLRITLQEETPTVVTPALANHRHPVTGLFLRQYFVDKLTDALAGPTAPGVTVLAYMKPDDMDETRDLLDPIASDQLMVDMAGLLKNSVKPNDLYGQFGGDIFMVLLSRGTLQDARAWAEELLRSIRKHVFEAGDKSLPMSCTVGLTQLNPHADNINTLMHKAQQAFRNGRDKGGDRFVLIEKDGTVGGGKQAIPVEVIKQSLMHDKFRLAFQPVASMMGKSRRMFDVLIRMVNEQGKEIMPADFLPVARQNGLMKNIDRWVIGNSIAFCVKDRPTQLFIRLSEESIPDRTLIPWIGTQLKQHKVSPSQLVFQITEQNAEEHLKEAKEMAHQVSAFGCGFAIEHFGMGHRPLQILDHIPASYIKVDGSLMEGLVRNREIQQRVRLYIESAKAKNMETIAERVEDANTMAVLWQLGVEFIQGYYVQGPEEVVMESA
ncbi:MAG: EAL domain-containing protein [Gammaproteobacteria bacterium]|nr:EAL domain-containing protein [Gammaproteobacteria bacterium]